MKNVLNESVLGRGNDTVHSFSEATRLGSQQGAPNRVAFVSRLWRISEVRNARELKGHNCEDSLLRSWTDDGLDKKHASVTPSRDGRVIKKGYVETEEGTEDENRTLRLYAYVYNQMHKQIR